ncbi:S1-like domain-containing protein [Neolecta irregularis DAH-3]|uniref:S1-like domain-containing protein n=1 Tax=Neolecta irregularis (strain DAH-3) TaxID=1198029 RepID=A0A1U7LV08_NEOID|nr:S1-like domain-containing protein [Neolecta irregularis DAH-3]|eukprot:OLL26413.1 S1-like domain-containing protein [Neolecta irregularis DAH-3]
MSRRRQQALSQSAECLETLDPSNEIVKIKSSQGQYLYMVENCRGEEYLVELPRKFRSVAWIKRGGFVVVELLESSDIKIKGNIVQIVRDLKKWRGKEYW